MQSQYSISGDRKHTSNKEGLSDQFFVPSWMDSSAAYPTTLSGRRDLLPENRGYNPRNIFNKPSGETAFLTPDNTQAMTYDDPILDIVVNLEEAKHHASECCSRLVLARTTTSQSRDRIIKQAASAVKESQRQVSSNRIAMIKKLLSHMPQDLIQEIEDGDKPPKQLYVTYNKYKSTNDKLINPLQSQYAWTLNTHAVKAYETLVYTKKSGIEKSKAWNILLSSAINACNHEQPWSYDLIGCTGANMDVLFEQTKFRFTLDADYWLAPETSSKTIDEFTGRYHLTSGDICHFTGLIGAMDMNSTNHKQSSKINSVTQQTITHSIYQFLHFSRQDNADDRAAADPEYKDSASHNHVNLVNVSIKIQHGDETHVLTFMPFAGHEACTVSHILITQSPDTKSDSPIGILKIPEEPAFIQSLPIKTSDDMNVMDNSAYTCIGAYRNQRLNEQELCKIHTDGWLGTLGDTYSQVLLVPDQINYDNPIPSARAVKTSCTGWDVLTTSFNVTTEVYTLITCINYPPYGTQIPEKRIRMERQNSKSGDHHPPASRTRYPGNFASQTPSGVYQPNRPANTRPPREDKWKPNLGDRSFHVHAVIGNDPWSESNTVYFVEPSEKKHQLYPAFQDKLKNISAQIYERYHTVWNPDVKFYENLKENPEIRNFWQTSWQAIIRESIENMKNPDTGRMDDRNGYWSSPNLELWEKILPDAKKRAIYMNLVATSKIGKPVMKKNMSDTIPLPRRLATAPTKPVANPDMTRIQARIQALESQLDTSRQEANNAHLLKQVLSKLAR